MDLNAVLDDLEIDIGLSQMDIKANKVTTSTGLLSLDLMLSGGMVTGGWYTMFGGEQSSKCLVGESLVLTNKGLLRLDEIYLNSSKTTTNGFNDIKDTLLVISHDDTQKVANKVYIGKGSTYRIKTGIGDELEGLPDHKILVLVEGKLKWLRFDEIKKGMMVPKRIGQQIYADEEPTFDYKPDLAHISSMTEENRKISLCFPSVISEELAEMFGWLVSEASSNGRFHNASPQALQRFNALSESVFNVPCSIVTDKYCCLHGLANDFILSHIGNVTSADRFTPAVIRQSPKYIQAAYLRSLFEGDGTVAKTVQLSSISKRLITETKYMLENMGMFCFIDEHKTWATNGGPNQKSKIGYRLNVHIDFLEIFRDEIGFLSERKIESLNQLIEKRRASDNCNTKSGWTHTIPGKELAIRLIEIVNEISPNFGLNINQGQSEVFRKVKTKDLRLHGVGLSRHKYNQIIGALEEHGLTDKLPKEGLKILKSLKKISTYFWAPVVDKGRTRLKKLVFDLNVPGTHSYLVNGTISHNSTLVMTQMARAVAMPIPYILYFDYEGSFSSDYFLSIARHVGSIPSDMPEDAALQKIFGLKDEKGKWVIAPRVRYYPMSIGEKFFDMVAKLERILPDKLYKNNKWWLVYDDTKENKKIIKDSKTTFDEKLYKSTGKYWVETDNGYPQALIAVDSYPAMMPEKQDVDDPNNSIGMQARMFADNIKRIKGKMSPKRITVMGINQLRQKPMVAYGCYHGSVKVTMADGTQYPIKEVVEKKMTGPVLAYNTSTNSFEPKPITQWFNNGPAKKWLKLSYAVDKNKKGNRSSSIVVTPEHLMWSNDYNTLLAASKFKVGDTLLAPTKNVLSAHAKQLFLGMMLGDGFYKVSGNYVKLAYSHKIEHSWYVDWKYSIFNFGSKYNSDSKSTHELPFIYEPELAKFVKERKNKCTGHAKRLSKEFAESLSPISLAVWYMDDSSKTKNLMKMQSYPIEDVEMLCAVLNKKYRTNCVVKKWKDRNSKTNEGYGLQFDKKMMTIIAPYIHRNFKEVVANCVRANCLSSGTVREKTINDNIPKYTKLFGEFKGWVSCSDIGSTPVEITGIEEISNPKLSRQCNYGGNNWTINDDSRYEIEVKDLGLFVADGVVGKNSPDYEPCFIGSTQVLLADGTTETIKNIVDNKQKVEVLSFDPSTGEVSVKSVVDWKDNGTRKTSDLINLKYQVFDVLGNPKEATITCTKQHKIWTSFGWKQAESLAIDDTIFLFSKSAAGEGFLQKTKILALTELDLKDEYLNVYDLTVEDNHTYFVGDSIDNAKDAYLAVSNCGESLKFFSDTRIKMTSRSVQGGSGQIEEEEGINGGSDQYRYIHMRAHKNKLSIPNLECWARIWVKDAEGQAHGYDPVYDCITGDSLINTNKGMIPIRDIPKYANTSVQVDNKVVEISGLTALGHDGQYHNISAWIKQGKKEVYNVRTKSGHTLSVTANHKFYVLTSAGDFEWRKTQDLAIDDYLLVSNSSEFPTQDVELKNNYVRQRSGRGTNQHANILPNSVIITEKCNEVLSKLQDSKLSPIPIKSIKSVGVKETYDISVDDSHSFIANGIAVHNCFFFCKELGIVSGTKNRLKFDLPKMKGHKPLSWLNFKKLILGDKLTIKKVLNQHGVEKPFFLRNELFKLFENGKAMEMYFAKKKSDVDGSSSSESESESDSSED